MDKNLSDKYVNLMAGVMTKKRWRKVIKIAYLDAIGKTINSEGKIVRDPKSTAVGRARARNFFANYLMGVPVSIARIAEMSKQDQEKTLAGLSDEELEAVVRQAEQWLGSNE